MHDPVDGAVAEHVCSPAQRLEVLVRMRVDPQAGTDQPPLVGMRVA